MTETSDSGFTEINQSRTSEGSQCDTKSGNASPNLNSLDENNFPATCENLTTDAVGSEIEEQKMDENDDDSSSSSSSEDSDEDYDDSDQSGSEKKSVFSWVSILLITISESGCVI
jgi:hypothetical protein